MKEKLDDISEKPRLSATQKAIGASVFAGVVQIGVNRLTKSTVVIGEAMHNIFIDAGFYGCILLAERAKLAGSEAKRKSLIASAGFVAVASSLFAVYEAVDKFDDDREFPVVAAGTMLASAAVNRQIHVWYKESSVKKGVGHSHAKYDKESTYATAASSVVTLAGSVVGINLSAIESVVTMGAAGYAGWGTATEAKRDYFNEGGEHQHCEHSSDHNHGHEH
jgi:hypothetical protein